MSRLQPLVTPLCDGSKILTRRITGWVTAPKLRDVPEDAPEGTKPEPDTRAPVKRLALLAVGGYAVLASDYTTYAVAAAAVGWPIAAWMHGASDDAPSEAPAPARPAEPHGLARWLLDLIGDRKGVHLRELYPAMRSLPGQQDRTDAELRAALTTLGVPVQRSMRVGSVPGRSGVRRTDVKALLPRPESSRLSKDGDADQDADSPEIHTPVEAVETR